MNIRVWEKLKYYCPKDVLVSLRDVEKNFPLEKFPYKTATLRTESLKLYGESRQCALFCYGISQALGICVWYAQYEESDYDYVGYIEEENAFFPIQMKEFVPEKINSEAGLVNELKKLSKYSGNLWVAVYLNREFQLDFTTLELPKLDFSDLWFFGAADPKQEKWNLIGNVLNSPNSYIFEYPNA